jgi:hypothetical protein
MIDCANWIPNKTYQYPDFPDNVEKLRIEDNLLETIRFGSTIPMTVDSGGQSGMFPDLSRHPRLKVLVMAYVSVTRGSNGKQAAASTIPATAVLVLSDQLGLKPLLKAKGTALHPLNNLRFFVDIKEHLVQQLADELVEQLADLAVKEFGAEWKLTDENVERNAKGNKEVLRQIYWERPDGMAEPITKYIKKLSWSHI